MTGDLTGLLGAILGPLCGAVAAYAAIRADLAVLRERLSHHNDRLRRLEDAGTRARPES